MRASYPDDDDGDALKEAEARGADMSKPMRIEFSIDVPDVERARSLSERIAAHGYKPEIFINDEDGSVISIARASCWQLTMVSWLHRPN